MNLSKNKTSNPRPPEKGSFPLDHFEECKGTMKAYVDCLRANDNVSRFCREESKKYLSCRMSKGLMATEELSKLGFESGSGPADISGASSSAK